MQDLGPSPYTDPAPPPESSPFTSYAAPPPPFAPSEAAFSVPASNMLFELRPLSMGEILDRTFALYRRRFWLFSGLASITAIVSTLSQLLQFLFFHPAKTAGPPSANDIAQLMIQAGVLVLTSLVLLCVYAVTEAATISALISVYLGDETSIGIAFRTVRGRWFRYICIVIWQLFSAMWLPMVLLFPAAVLIAIPGLRWLSAVLFFLAFASFIYSAIAFIRNSLGIAAATVENLGIRASMRRSKVLVAGHKVRVFVVYLLLWALSLAGGVIVLFTTQATQVSHGAVRAMFEAITLLVTFLNNAIIGPVGAIGLAIFYLDERVRKEGFDVELLMLRGAPPPPPEPPVGPPADLPAEPAAEPAPETLPSPFTSEIV